MPDPLYISYSKLLTHFNRSGSILTEAVDTSAKLKVEPVPVSSSLLIGGLVGSGCDFIARNGGPRVPVAPLLDLGQGLWVWLGYHEEWHDERVNNKIKKLSFKSARLSFYIGPRNNMNKPQMFRVEWAGWAKWDGPVSSFQAANAAHPHWQFDALDSLSNDENTQRAAQLLRRLKAEVDPEILEFSPQLSDVDVRDIVATQKLDRIHFASAAAWWKPPPHDGHVHNPNEPTDIEKWVQHSLDYIKIELGRL